MTKHFPPLITGSGPGLVLAHGGGGGVQANFGPLIDDLARTHTVVGLDYPGSGTRPRATRLDLDELADELVEAASGLEKFTLLAYSLGCAVAVRAATRHPGRVTGLILTSGFARPNTRMGLAVDIWRELLGHDRTLLAKFLTLVAAGERHLDALTPEQLEKSVGELAEFLPAGSAEQIDLVDRVDLREELAGIGVPTLVVATTLDALAPPANARELAAGIPGAKLTEIECGHNIGSEAPEEWLAAIRGFLAEVA